MALEINSRFLTSYLLLTHAKDTANLRIGLYVVLRKFCVETSRPFHIVGKAYQVNVLQTMVNDRVHPHCLGGVHVVG